jgi:hypothetical protein
MQPNANMHACEIVKWAEDTCYAAHWPCCSTQKWAKKATERVHRKLLHPEAGREGVTVVNLFSPLRLAAVPKANKAYRVPDRSLWPADRKLKKPFPWKICYYFVFYSRKFGVHTYCTYIRGHANTVNIFCKILYYYWQSSSSREMAIYMHEEPVLI